MECAMLVVPSRNMSFFCHSSDIVRNGKIVRVSQISSLKSRSGEEIRPFKSRSIVLGQTIKQDIAYHSGHPVVQVRSQNFRFR